MSLLSTSRKKAPLLILFLLLFASQLLYAQSQTIILPAERVVRADKGEPAMNRKVCEVILDQSGYYRVYGKVFYNSGNLQRNESFFLDLRSNTGINYYPQDPNAGTAKVIPDDPGPPHSKWHELGLFNLSGGRYQLWMHHYALIYQKYPQFLMGTMTDPESVRLIDSVKVVYYPATLDVSVKLTAQTAHTWQINDTLQQVVLPSETFFYRLVVKNNADFHVPPFRLWNELPDSVTAFSFSDNPDSVIGKVLEWNIAELSARDSLVYTFSAKTPAKMPIGYEYLLDYAHIEINNDNTAKNNDAYNLVLCYAQEQVPRTDVQLFVHHRTDSLAITGTDTSYFAVPGKTILYDWEIVNNGPATAEDVRFTNPLSRSFLNPQFSLAPQLTGDTLYWNLGTLQPGERRIISYAGQLDARWPENDKIFSNVGVISAPADSNLLNNKIEDQLPIAFPPPPPPPPLQVNFDLAVNMSAQTDTSIALNGAIVPAVKAGHSFSYRLTLHNQGPAAAKQISLSASLPDSVSPLSFSRPPLRQTADSLFWLVDSLAKGDSLLISYQATLAKLLPLSPMPLPSAILISAEHDSTDGNNRASLTVYGLNPPPPPPPPLQVNFDLAVNMSAQTDTSIALNGAIVPAVKAGHSFSYRLTLHNQGPAAAKQISLSASLPDSVSPLSFSRPPLRQTADSLFWLVDSLAKGDSLLISYQATLAKLLPLSPMPLPSAILISAEHDSTDGNNRASLTVYGLNPPPPPPPPLQVNFDLAVNMSAQTDTSIALNGAIAPAVKAGHSFSYRLTLHNQGPAAAKQISLSASLPDSVSPLSFSRPPLRQTADSLFWLVDSLAKGDSLLISYQATLAKLLPLSPMPLPSAILISAEHDSTDGNNRASLTVYGLNPPPPPPPPTYADVAVQQYFHTDSLVISGADSTFFARLQEIYSGQIVVKNIGGKTATSTRLAFAAPAVVQLQNITIPAVTKADSLIWNIGDLTPGQVWLVRYNARMPDLLPLGRNPLKHSAVVSAGQENPQSLQNNVSIRTLFNVVYPVIPPVPEITANPPVVEIANPAHIRVQVSATVASWDLWVYLADGHIDSSYADSFIAAHSLPSGQWLDIDPDFRPDRLYTTANEEPVIFEIRVRSITGQQAQARAGIMVKSSNALDLDTNLWDPGKDRLHIHFKLSTNRNASLDVYDVAGSHVCTLTDRPFSAGWNEWTWDGRTDNGLQTGSGVYIITLVSGEFKSWKKVMIVR